VRTASLKRRVEKLEKRSGSSEKVAEAIQQIMHGISPTTSNRVSLLAEKFVRETSRAIAIEDNVALAALNGVENS